MSVGLPPATGGYARATLSVWKGSEGYKQGAGSRMPSREKAPRLNEQQGRDGQGVRDKKAIGRRVVGLLIHVVGHPPSPGGDSPLSYPVRSGSASFAWVLRRFVWAPAVSHW